MGKDISIIWLLASLWALGALLFAASFVGDQKIRDERMKQRWRDWHIVLQLLLLLIWYVIGQKY